MTFKLERDMPPSCESLTFGEKKRALGFTKDDLIFV